MTESAKTMMYAGVAVIALLTAWLGGPSTPKPGKGQEKIGQPFFPDFTDAAAAKTLEVVSFNPDTATARIFGIKYENGIYRIPSRFNYPADAKDRLGKTAASLIGIKRDLQVGRRAAEHAEFEVVDPRDQESAEIKGRGNRLTLKDASEKVLADFIIGKEVPNKKGYYYVRRADEKETYQAKLEIQLTTKFTDWIEPDLLKLDAQKLVNVTINKMTLEIDPRGRGKITGEETNRLTRGTANDPWKLEPLDEAKEEVNQDEVKKLVSVLDELKIAGVRPKPKQLSEDLKGDEGMRIDQESRADLQDIGFYLVPTKRGGMQMLSKEGQLMASTDQGVLYMLSFGDVFSATEEEIEVGFAKSSKAKPDTDKKDDGKKDDASKTEALKKKSRYLFVQVEFDPASIPGKPEAPVEPQKPSATPAKSADSDAATSATDPANPAAPAVDPEKEYQEQKLKYDTEMKLFPDRVKQHEQKIAEGEKLVKELKTRFAEWYYVIDGDVFENLRQGRKSLVKEKSAATGEAGADAGANPLQKATGLPTLDGPKSPPEN